MFGVSEEVMILFKKKEGKALKAKAVQEGINLDQLTPEMREAFANDYVETIRKGKIIYTRDFYKTMANYIRADMTYVEAYKACGFNVDALGKDRANSAGKRAVAMEKDGSLYRVSPTEMNATIPLDQMDLSKMDIEHMCAYYQARCMYLEAELEYEKEKKRLICQAAVTE